MMRAGGLALALAAGCASGKATGDDDAGGPVWDAGPAHDARMPPPDARISEPTRFGPTNGGGAASSPGYEAIIRIGGPQPAGDTGDEQHEVRTGAGAQVP